MRSSSRSSRGSPTPAVRGSSTVDPDPQDLEASLLEPGDVLDGRYEIVGLIGAGGFAEVFVARQLNIGRLVAVKVVDLGPGVRGAAEVRRRFLQETKVSAALAHPGIVKVLDYGLTDGGFPFMVMELLNGLTLHDQISAHGPLTLGRAASLMVECLDATAVAHGQGVVHRDLKPSNLFLCDPGTRSERLCILDFGLAFLSQSGDGRLTKTGLINGTPKYLAPEYITNQVVTPALDVYQLGLVFVEMLTGRPPVEDDNPFACCMRHCSGQLDIPEEVFASAVGATIRGAVTLDHHARFADARHFRDSLLSALPAVLASDTVLATQTLASSSAVWSKLQRPQQTALGQPVDPFTVTERQGGAVAPELADIEVADWPDAYFDLETGEDLGLDDLFDLPDASEDNFEPRPAATQLGFARARDLGDAGGPTLETAEMPAKPHTAEPNTVQLAVDADLSEALARVHAQMAPTSATEASEPDDLFLPADEPDDLFVPADEPDDVPSEPAAARGQAPVRVAKVDSPDAPPSTAPEVIEVAPPRDSEPPLARSTPTSSSSPESLPDLFSLVASGEVKQRASRARIVPPTAPVPAPPLRAKVVRRSGPELDPVVQPAPPAHAPIIADIPEAEPTKRRVPWRWLILSALMLVLAAVAWWLSTVL